MAIKVKMKLLAETMQKKRVTHIPGTILSQSKAAAMAGLKKATYWEVETGKTKNIDAITLFKIAQWVNKPMEYFFIKTKK